MPLGLYSSCWVAMFTINLIFLFASTYYILFCQNSFVIFSMMCSTFMCSYIKSTPQTSGLIKKDHISWFCGSGLPYVIENTTKSVLILFGSFWRSWYVFLANLEITVRLYPSSTVIYVHNVFSLVDLGYWSRHHIWWLREKILRNLHNNPPFLVKVLKMTWS